MLRGREELVFATWTLPDEMRNITEMDIGEFCKILRSVGEDKWLEIEMYSDWRSDPTTKIKDKTFRWTSKRFFAFAFIECKKTACS
jgi:hypothetical protein